MSEFSPNRYWRQRRQITWIFRLPGCYPLVATVNWTHKDVAHKERLAGRWFNWCILEISPPSSGRRLWVYTHWLCPYVDLVIDRRPRMEER